MFFTLSFLWFVSEPLPRCSPLLSSLPSSLLCVLGNGFVLSNHYSTPNSNPILFEYSFCVLTILLNDSGNKYPFILKSNVVLIILSPSNSECL